MIVEVWMPLTECNNYWVSNFGRVKSVIFLKRWNGYRETILKFHTDRYGYCILSIKINGIKKYFKVHRIVAKVFVPNTENKPCINHIDCDKKNNRFMNLEWCTNIENIHHAQENGRRKKGITNAYIKKGFKKVVNTKTGVVYESANKLAALLHWDAKYLRKRLSGEVKNKTDFMYLIDFQSLKQGMIIA